MSDMPAHLISARLHSPTIHLPSLRVIDAIERKRRNYFCLILANPSVSLIQHTCSRAFVCVRRSQELGTKVHNMLVRISEGTAVPEVGEAAFRREAEAPSMS